MPDIEEINNVPDESVELVDVKSKKGVKIDV